MDRDGAPVAPAVPPVDDVLAAAPGPMGLAVDGRWHAANDALATLLVGAGGDLRGQHLAATLGATLADVVGRVGPAGRSATGEGPLPRAEAEERWAIVSAATLEGPAGPGTLVQVTDATAGHRDRTALARSERWLRTLIGSIGDAISVVDERGELMFTTGAEARFLGYTSERWTGVEIRSIIHPDDLPAALDAFLECLRTPQVEVVAEVRVRSASGAWVDISATAVNQLGDPEVRGIVVTTSDITELRGAQRLASSQAAVLELIARGAPLSEVLDRCVGLVEENGLGGRSSIYLLDDDRLEMRAGRAPDPLNEYMRDPPHDPPKSLCDLAFATGRAAYLADIGSAGPAWSGLREVALAVGVEAGWSQPILGIGSGEVLGTLSTIYDEPHTPDRHEQQVGELACSLVAIALERVEVESRLAHQALHDGLTGLPNRTLLLDRLDHVLARRRSTDGLALLFCDLDRFKVVNDSLGHGVGDQLLVAVADRLVSTIAPGNTVARFGGDEFVVLLDDPDEHTEPAVVADRIRAVLADPFEVPSGQEVHLTVSIGLAIADDHRVGDSWLRDADAAMYRAKETGRDRMVVFDTDLRDAAVDRLQVENDLRRAVERDELVVHYQPVVDLASGRIVGAEALVRWQHPARGLLGPDAFIDIAEEIGTIDELGRWVLDRSVSDLSGVAACRGGPFHLGVNLSLRQLAAGDFDLVVASVCRRYGWRPEDLLLEVTETALASGMDRSLELLERISALGVGLAIDDFGTGHSSLTRLGRMPVGLVKIDRSFVSASERPGAGPDRRMVQAVTALAGALDLRTSAEGVETVEQLEHVRRCGCHVAQGYLFSRPLPIDDFVALLATEPRW